jgi:hypothetical protein
LLRRRDENRLPFEDGEELGFGSGRTGEGKGRGGNDKIAVRKDHGCGAVLNEM